MGSHKKMRRKICVITTNRADYGRLKPAMEAIRAHPGLELQVVAATPLFFDNLLWYLRHGEPVSFWKSIPWYVRARLRAFKSGEEIFRHSYPGRLLREGGFPIHARIPMFLEGGNTRIMTKMAGLCLLGLPEVFEKLRPDVVLINGDRFEMLPVAFAAAYSNILLAHVEGGDISGTIDESVRHAVTKLAHLHFPVTELSAQRLRQMGENSGNVFTIGSLVIDFLKSLDLSLSNEHIYSRYRPWGAKIDFTKPYLLVVHHPVTTEYEANHSNTKELIGAIDGLNMQTLIISSNIDAGSDGVSKAFKEYRDERRPSHVAFSKNFSPEDFSKLLANASVAIGNSSSFIREGAFLGTPAVVVGTRQQARERGRNVMEVSFTKGEIMEAVQKQLGHGKYSSDKKFGDGQAATRLSEILARVEYAKVPLQKKFFDSSRA